MRLLSSPCVKIACILSVCVLLPGCLFDSGTDNVVDDYEVGWIDLIESRALHKQVELVPGYVFAVGHDSKFVFAKQHSVFENSTKRIDTSVTYYYIIERSKDEYQDKPKFGPLTKERFKEKCIELGIKNPEFDMTYPTNF